MTQQELWDEFQALPAEAQRRVAEYIATLSRQRCCPDEETFGLRRNDDADLLSWRNAVDYFETIKPGLWKDKNYRHRYVAIRQQKLIDVDDDKFPLVQRVRQQHPDDVVFVAKVERMPPVAEIPSPEIGP